MHISLCVSNLCLLKREKNLTLKTCAPDFSARLMTKLYAKIKGTHTVSLFDFLTTWQVCSRERKILSYSQINTIASDIGFNDNLKQFVLLSIKSYVTAFLYNCLLRMKCS